MSLTAQENTTTFEACWNYILELYSKQGIPESCLLLQDRLGVDVSFLLTVIFYADQKNFWIEATHLKQLDRSISDWRQQTVWPLREIRIRLKHGLLENPSAIADELYRQIKASEIMAEKGEIEILTRTLDRNAAFESSTGNLRKTILDVVEFYAGKSSGTILNPLDDKVQQAISFIAVSARSKKART